LLPVGPLVVAIDALFCSLLFFTYYCFWAIVCFFLLKSMVCCISISRCS
jgi:hypothetical protein